MMCTELNGMEKKKKRKREREKERGAAAEARVPLSQRKNDSGSWVGGTFLSFSTPLPSLFCFSFPPPYLHFCLSPAPFSPS